MTAYLDYAATAPLCAEAAQAMAPYLSTGAECLPWQANANALYAPAREAFMRMEAHRKQIAHDLGARVPAEIVFTSGATESDCAALYGIALAAAQKRRQTGGAAKDLAPSIVCSAIEHPAILRPADMLGRLGFDVRLVQPDSSGIINPEAVEAACDRSTVLVSVQTVNSEIGSIQPVHAIAEAAHRAKALFHTDATQALGKVPIGLAESGVDAASFSGHKVGAPKGTGILYLRQQTPYLPVIDGGGQESGRRSGTQNLCGIAGLAAAVHAAVQHRECEAGRLRALQRQLVEGLTAIRGVQVSMPYIQRPADYVASTVHLTVEGFESETLVLQMDARGICVSGGAACSSSSLEPSHVLTAIGFSRDRAYGALRVSLGCGTYETQIRVFLECLKEIVEGGM